MQVSRPIARLIAPTLTVFFWVKSTQTTRIPKILPAFANATCAFLLTTISGLRMPFFKAKFR